MRFLTGLGLGGALPNTLSLAAEYSPRRASGFAVAAVSACVPAGGLIGGFAVSLMLPLWGWQSVFIVGGTVPLLLAALLLAYLPESLKFLIARGASRAQIEAVFRRMYVPNGPLPILGRRAETERGAIRELFGDGRTATTLLLWLSYFMNLLIMYFIVSWLPSLLRASSFPVSAGANAIMLFSFGAVLGSLMQRPLSRFSGSTALMVIQFVMFIFCSIWLARMRPGYSPTMFIVFVMGYCIVGAQIGLNIFNSGFYPTTSRATGLGWGLGIGRAGSIVGPLLGGFMLKAAWTVEDIFLAGVIPALIACTAVLVNGMRLAAKFRTRAALPLV
jgi:MFS transporter, AAHS family, 4-hydroxybenzoate transporter